MLLHVDGTLCYTLYMHTYWALKDILKEILDGESNKGKGLCIDNRPMQIKNGNYINNLCNYTCNLCLVREHLP